MDVQRFLREENEAIARLSEQVTHAAWMVNTTGEKKWQEAEVEAERAYRRHFADRKRFEKIAELREKALEGSLERRQLDRLYQEALENQVPEELLDEMVRLSSELSNIFNTFRGTVDGRKVTENEVRNVLATSTDSEEREKVWRASKQIGREVEKGLIRLVKLRNEAARRLGFEDHHQMMFELSELDRDEVFSLFGRLKGLTDEPFRRIKGEIDAELGEKFGLEPGELRPWHYSDPFFQEAPPVTGLDMDVHYRGKNIEKLTADTFSALGLEIRDMLAKSDLYEREGKNQHAFCLDMNRRGDVRVLCNIRDNEYWMSTMLHEFGHAVYDKYGDRNLPFILRTPAHIFTTEAVAMFFGRLTRNREWLERFPRVDRAELSRIMPQVEKMLKRQMLIVARWIITFVTFEMELYRDPDQDLNRLWWKLVREIQYVNPPEETDEPHWASKIHFTIAPVYYQNYLLGELTASQFDAALRRNGATSLFTEETGRFFLEKVFQPGDRSGWSVLIEEATGEALNPEHFVNQFVRQ